MKARIVAVLAFAVVTGCASSSGGGSTSTGSLPRVNEHPDPAVIASEIGCTNYQPLTTIGPEAHAATEGSCDLPDGPIGLLTFNSASAEAKWATGVKGATGDEGKVVVGDGFTIESTNAHQAVRLAKTLAGTTQ